jgi:hypothetical protein
LTDAMPHLDDAGENADVVALLMQQHNHIRDLFAEVENATADDREEAFRRLVRLPTGSRTVWACPIREPGKTNWPPH